MTTMNHRPQSQSPSAAAAASADSVPTFPTLSEIKHSIPNRCFESDAATSLYYVARAWIFTAILMTTLYTVRSSPWLQQYRMLDILACLAYVYLQGVVFWGFFTIGHDCGHSSFSRYHTLNFIVGCFMHSAILTPFESWRITHRHHHKNTGNIDKDEIFYPHRESDNYKTARNWVFGLGSAWFVYLKTGYAPRTMSHFDPWDPLLINRATAVMVSLSVFATAATGIAYLTYHLGLATMGLYYFAPLFVFASFLVITTFLHHNDEDTPWYGDAEWTYVKGNLSSVDRSYGWLVDTLSHHIGTHQVHHLFPIIPHYKLTEATTYFRAAYPQFVRESKEPILSAFYKSACLFSAFGEVPDNAQTFTLGGAAATAAAACKSKKA